MTDDTFDVNAYLRAELRGARQRVDFLERERHRLERLVASLLDLLMPSSPLTLLDALAEAHDLNPAGQGPTPPTSRRHRFPERRMTDLLGPTPGQHDHDE